MTGIHPTPTVSLSLTLLSLRISAHLFVFLTSIDFYVGLSPSAVAVYDVRQTANHVERWDYSHTKLEPVYILRCLPSMQLSLHLRGHI